MMGYVSRDIALIDEPGIVTLSNSPNFVQFRSKLVTGRTKLELTIKIQDGQFVEKSKIIISAPDGTVYTFSGTQNADAISGNAYYVVDQTSDTAENFRQALLLNSWIAANFDISIPFILDGGVLKNGDVLHLTSKGYGRDYNIGLITPDDPDSEFYKVVWVNQISRNKDTISGESSTAEIELDIYRDPRTFLGTNDVPDTPEKLGTYDFSIQKTYVSQNPVWFNLNALFLHREHKLPPASTGWFNPETVTSYRFTAKVKGVNSFYFYQSNALYVLQGYGRKKVDLTPYIYVDGETVKLLTNKPRTKHYPGQKEYLNFIFSFDYDKNRGFDVHILGKIYTTSGEYLGYMNGNTTIPVGLTTVNTCILNMEFYTGSFSNAGLVRIYLARNGVIVSNALEYEIVPECLHTLRSFSFVNRLGGWDSVNFDADIKDEVKPQISTYNKTVTPSFRDGDSIETVYGNELSNAFTIKGAPVNNEVAEWLKEFAEARTIIDSNGRYVVVDDFTLAVSKDNDNMQVPTLKYHYSR